MFIRTSTTLLAAILTITAVTTTAQTTPPSAGTGRAAKQIFVPAGTEQAYDAIHYAPAVRVGDLVVVSGVPAAGPGEFEDQLRRMFTRIKENLAAAGASLDDVVELESFHRGAPDSAAFQAEFRRVRSVHAEFFTENYPAWTAVGNAVLLAPNALVEMRAMAIVGSGRNATVRRSTPTNKSDLGTSSQAGPQRD